MAAKPFSFHAGLWLVLMMAGCTFLSAEYQPMANEFRVYEHTAPLNDADYVAFLGDGTAMVSGEVMVKRRDGKIIHGEGFFMYLVPVTPYTQEWFEHAIVQDHKVGGVDPRSLRATRATTVGTAGRFQFPNVQAGKYYLICSIMQERQIVRFLWVTEARPAGADIKAYALVTVNAGEQVNVTVTRLDS